MRANQRHAAHQGRQRPVGDQVLHLLRQRPYGGAGQQVPEGEQRVGLATTEVGLQVDDRARVQVPADPADRPVQQLPQSLGEERAAEELHRVRVLLAALALSDHVQVGGELGGGEVAGRDVLVRSQHLAPRLEPLPGDGDPGLLLLDDAAGLGLEHRALVVGAQPPHLLCLAGRAGRGEQTLHRVQRTVGVVRREGGIVRPAVAGVA